MINDPVIKEIHEIREAYAEQFGFDLDAVFADLKVKEQQSKRCVVKREPKRVSQDEAA